MTVLSTERGFLLVFFSVIHPLFEIINWTLFTWLIYLFYMLTCCTQFTWPILSIQFFRTHTHIHTKHSILLFVFFSLFHTSNIFACHMCVCVVYKFSICIYPMTPFSFDVNRIWFGFKCVQEKSSVIIRLGVVFLFAQIFLLYFIVWIIWMHIFCILKFQILFLQG